MLGAVAAAVVGLVAGDTAVTGLGSLADATAADLVAADLVAVLGDAADFAADV